MASAMGQLCWGYYKANEEGEKVNATSYSVIFSEGYACGGNAAQQNTPHFYQKITK